MCERGKGEAGLGGWSVGVSLNSGIRTTANVESAAMGRGGGRCNC